ncbi:MAG TPA: ABC transporter ATP-binding protein [Tepidisphaeraceae bacterium]|nr:ABC transporter ATP-binding protein [Tepidisphaeraceae bacterium]
MAEDHLNEEDPFHPRIDWALWRKILIFARPYRRLLLVLSILGGLCAGCDVLLPWLTGRLIDLIKLDGASAPVFRYGFAYLSAVAILASCIWTFIVVAGRITTGVSYDIRTAAFAKLQELPFSFYDKKAVGWLMARMTSDCSNLSRVMGWALLDLVWGTCVLTGITIAMFIRNWKLALVVLLIVPPLLWISRFFQVRLLLTSRALRKANSHTTAGFNEGIVGVRTSKSLVREKQNLVEFSGLTSTMYGHAVSNALYSALFLPLVLAVCSIGVGLALWRGGLDVLGGAMTLGTLVTFIQYAAFIQNPVQELANMLTMIQGAQASAERIVGLLDTDPQIKDSADVLARIEEHRKNPRINVALDGLTDHIDTIEFRDVTFSYNAGQEILHSFNLTVEAGQSIALVGPTGGGKTTIVGLLCRFYEPTSGQILINGADYRQRSLRWLQSKLGIVLQQPHLFSGTIKENIRYGKLSATDEEIIEAAKHVNAHEFITALEGGYNAPVGEGGGRLSTGQKQLIALARAILANPQIFIMDEATSSVDTQTERSIQSAVEHMLEDRISFVIAHRLSTIRSADRILVIENGQIVEQGPHRDLIRRRGPYFDLYTHQFAHEREEQVLDLAANAVQ